MRLLPGFLSIERQHALVAAIRDAEAFYPARQWQVAVRFGF